MMLLPSNGWIIEVLDKNPQKAEKFLSPMGLKVTVLHADEKGSAKKRKIELLEQEEE